MNRRALLTAIGTGTLSLGGCLSRPDPGGTPGTGTDTLPDGCPTSQDLGVEWPTDLDAGAVESFVEAYERVYYREVVVDYEPESDLDRYELAGSADHPEEAGDGWTVPYSGSGAVYRPTLWLEARTATPPDDADVVPASEVDDALLTGLLEDAAETGQAEHNIEPPGEKVDEYVDRLASLSADFEHLSGPGDSDSLFADVDGTGVELTAQASNFHGDYWWSAEYYVDERVVRRASGDDTDPRDGTLLECRRLD